MLLIGSIKTYICVLMQRGILQKRGGGEGCYIDVFATSLVLQVSTRAVGGIAGQNMDYVLRINKCIFFW